ncbi:60S ribosomal protein L5 [Cytidiella melzeri]|nr:60S ribosomal protein L5 [Cytidiella melzeri]
MPFVKNYKSNAYFSRFQVKYRRRREGKTDYYARKRLISQAKNKYNAPKYRLVVRFTNKEVICQIVYARIQGDFVLTAARSKELPRYGINHGLTNWTAAYATGLLVARRALTKLGLADKYAGVEEPDGTIQLTETLDDEDAPRPFRAYLDVGLRRTSTGSRVFGALKGASDGGIYIPHNEKRFPGYDVESKELDAETLKKYIFGGHVAEYMESLEEEDDERFKKQFASYLEDGIGSEDIQEIYTNAYAAIREDPVFKPTEKTKDWKAESLKYKTNRLTYEQRKANIQEKIAKFQETGGVAEEEEDDEEEDEE